MTPKNTQKEQRFRNYNDFYAFYLKEHSKPATRLIHCLGTLVGIFVFIPAAIVTGRALLILAGVTFAYALLWTSHFLIEKNRPATFKYPFWSFISDFRMLFDTLTGKLSIKKTL